VRASRRLRVEQHESAQRARDPRPSSTTTFEAAVQRALARNPRSLQVAAEIRRDRALLEQVRSTSLPTLGGGGVYARLDSNRAAGGIVLEPESGLNLSAWGMCGGLRSVRGRTRHEEPGEPRRAPCARPPHWEPRVAPRPWGHLHARMRLGPRKMSPGRTPLSRGVASSGRPVGTVVAKVPYLSLTCRSRWRPFNPSATSPRRRPRWEAGRAAPRR
jgi:hypothetical protein